MSNLATAVISGSVAAFRLVRQYLSNPAIIYSPNSDGLSIGFSTFSQTVVMQATKYRESLSVQASKMLLVDISQGKSFINDNIAPLPRVWEIEGFLFPLIPFIPITDQIQLEALKDTLRQAANSRQFVQFKPIVTSIVSQFSQAFTSLASGKITGTISVVILSIDFDLESTVQNKAPFRMTLQEIDTLSSALVTGSTLSGSPDGDIANPAASASSNNQGNTPNTSVLPSTVGF